MKVTCLLLTLGLAWGKASAGILVKEMPYTVVEKTQDYELRQYQTEKMVCTSMNDMDPTKDPMNGWEQKYHNPYSAMMFGPWQKEPSARMFYPLFDYIGGRGNADHTKIPMTSPVPFMHTPIGEGLETETQCFWLGTEYRNKEAPTPTSSDVTIVTMPAFEAYVKRFGGFALSDDDYRKPYNAFKKNLLAAGKQIKSDSWISCSYDAPFVPFNRRNEVWIEKA